MARKKRRTQHQQESEIAPPASRDVISTLPWELIAEILSMTSPQEVLALARCSRHFCDSLAVNPRSKRIWVNARKHCKPPIPDPTPNFTESAYAAYIFDGGPCEQCGKFVDAFYISFSMRLRVCEDKCRAEWMKEKGYILANRPGEDEKTVKRWVIGMEERSASDSLVFRKSDFLQVLEDYRRFIGQGKAKAGKVHDYYRLHQKDVVRNKVINDLSKALLDWTARRLDLAQKIKKQNNDMLEEIARKEGWKTSDVLVAPTCNDFYKLHNRDFEFIQVEDFAAIKRKVEAEVAERVKGHSRSREEQAYAKRREQVAKEYYRRKSIGSERTKPEVLPTLGVFRQLSMIKILQNMRGSEPDELATRMNDPSTRRMIDDSLSMWRSNTEYTFKKILNAGDFCPIGKKLDPLDRLTARFICTKCLEHASDESKVPPLDFRGACAHQCKHLTKQQKAKAIWSPKQFRLDQKAICATRKFLALLDVSDESEESLQKIDAKHNRILCKNCDGKMLLNFRAMQRHSHRHEDMDMEFLSPQQVKKLSSRPIEWGLCAELKSMAKSAGRKSKLKIYGCRHCLRYDNPEQELSEDKMELDEKNARSKESEEGGKQQKLMSFYGMHCHVLQSHGVTELADEDIYRVDDKA